MTSSTSFGPGHPDFDNQLDLFESAMAPPKPATQGSEQLSTSEAGRDSYPAEVICQTPCTACVSASFGLASLQMAVKLKARSQSPISEYNADDNCPLCHGTGSVRSKLARIEGHWWDWGQGRIIRAETSDLAQRKTDGVKVTPLFIEHGGYSLS